MKDENVVAIVAGATLMGALVDGVLRIEPWGLGFALVAAFATLVVTVVYRSAGHRTSMTTLSLSIGGIACGAMLVLRDSPTLVAFDLLFCAALLAAIPTSALGSKLARLGPIEWLLTTLVAAADAAVGSVFFLARDVPWPHVREARVGRPALAATRGVILAAPPLIVFGVLLASADAVFSHVLVELLDIDLEALLLHLFYFGLGSWLAAGWLARAAGDRPLPTASLALPASTRLGLAETAIVLGAIDLLFLGFVVVQLRYFFGGADVIEAVPGLTRAEYARSGFFQLVTVATLVVLLLLFVDWIVERSNQTLRWTRALSAFQILLVGIMLASAWSRMRLYVEEFGLTELRVYTSAFMIGLSMVLAWFCGTVLVGRRDRFAAGVVAMGVVALVALNVANPDAIIVRTNVARAIEGKTFDATYLSRLSADAVPAIVESLDSMASDRRAALLNGLEARAASGDDWRSWNVSRAAERDVLQGLPVLGR